MRRYRRSAFLDSQTDIDTGLELRVADSGFSSYVETIVFGVLLDLVVNEMALGGRLERIFPFGDKLDELIGQQFFDDLFRCFIRLGPQWRGNQATNFVPFSRRSPKINGSPSALWIPDNRPSSILDQPVSLWIGLSRLARVEQSTIVCLARAGPFTASPSAEPDGGSSADRRFRRATCGRGESRRSAPTRRGCSRLG